MFKIVSVLLVAFLAGCSEPVIDSTSEETFQASLEKLKNDMAPEQREELQEALQVVMFDEFDIKSIFAAAMSDGDLKEVDPNFGEDAMARMNGMTAVQIVSEADKIMTERRLKQIGVLQGEVKSLESEVQAMTLAKEEFELKRVEMAKIAFKKTKLYWRKSSFMDELVLELEVTNGLDQAISKIYAKGTLATPGRSVPWLTETFNYGIAGGLEPNETKFLALAPNQFLAWGNTPKDRDDSVFTVELINVEDSAGNKVFDTGYDLSKLEKLTDKLVSKKASLNKLQGNE